MSRVDTKNTRAVGTVIINEETGLWCDMVLCT